MIAAQADDTSTGAVPPTGLKSRSVSQAVALPPADAFWEALRDAENVTLAGSDDLQQGERTSPPRLPLIAISENAWRAIITSRPGTG